MRANIIYGALAVLTASPVSAHYLKILLGNDDGYGSANIREFYRFLKKAGHDVIMVAPVTDNSGQGGRSVFDSSGVLQSDGEFGLVAKGAPSIGQDPNDSHIWYYNGTPAACTFVGLDYVIPKIWGPGVVPDLYVGGPNVGTNLGSFLYTLSGTLGGTYAAIGRGIPGIAISGGSLYGQRSYKWINSTTPSGKSDPATIYGQLSTDLVNQIALNRKPGSPVLPLGYGLNVNYPSITSLDNDSCVAPKFYETRLTGGAFTDSAVYNASSGTFKYANNLASGVNACINGDCNLPGETTVVNSGCYSSVSVFTIDYDAPSGKDSRVVGKQLKPLVKTDKKTWSGKSHSKREWFVEADSPLRHA